MPRAIYPAYSAPSSQSSRPCHFPDLITHWYRVFPRFCPIISAPDVQSPPFRSDTLWMAHLDTISSSDRRAAPRGRQTTDQSVLMMIWRQRRVVLCCVGICLALACMYLLFAPRVYTATSRLLVQ